MYNIKKFDFIFYKIRLNELANKYCNDLVGFGYNSFTIDDFKDVFLDELGKLNDPNTTIETLENIFNENGTSDYIVVFLR